MNETVVEIWDWTKLAAYLTCDTKGKYGFEDHLVPSEPAAALAFGNGIHKMAEVWTLQHMAVQTGNVSSEAAMKHTQEAFLSIWEKELPFELREKLEMEGNRRSYANACRLFDAYTRKFPIEMFDKIVATEVPFTLYLGQTVTGREVSWSGILDRIVEWQGGIYYVDIKTSSYPCDTKFFEKFRFNGQMLGYAWAGRQLGYPNFNGIMIHGIEVKIPQVGIKLKKDGTPYAVQGRQAEELIQSDIIPISDEHIEEWKWNTLDKIERICQDRETSKVTGRRQLNMGDACNNFNGCQFRAICYSYPSLRPEIVAKQYKVRKWNPLNRDNEGVD